MKYLIILLLLSLACLVRPVTILAITDPLSVPNNRFGIHIVDPNDLSSAASLVNSGGGDWGYVTLVISQNDRDTVKWQNIFDTVRRLHLIPIIRIATQSEDDHWKKPQEEDINSWADFLSSLNWVTKNRYVIIYNEPNQANEWGGDIDPAGYANILAKFSDKLKQKSSDFFILAAGLDASAPNGLNTMDEVLFLRKMKEVIPDIFGKIDGWTSHSYPNPGFSGSPYGFGRGTVRTYLWEKNLLTSLGVNRDLLIFITETGWPHKEGLNYNNSYLSEATVAQYIKTAFSSVWLDNSIAAITPFVLSYQSYPFDNFSWKEPDGLTYYQQYSTVQDMSKLKGMPEQIINLNFIASPIPSSLITDSDYTFAAIVKNTGQAIFDENDGFDFTLTAQSTANINEAFNWQKVEINPIEPGKSGKIKFDLHTPKNPGIYKINLSLTHGGTNITSTSNQTSLIEPPSLSFSVITGIKNHPTAQDFSLIIYDENEKEIQKFKRLNINEGMGSIPKLKDVVIGKEYRIVILKPYYLPRQTKLTFKKGTNTIAFKPMLPLDLDLDGKFTLNDYWLMITHPIFVLKLLF